MTEAYLNSRDEVTDMGQVVSRKIDPTIQETIRVTMQRLSNDGKRAVTKKHILKVIYLARKRLPKDSNIRQELAYYWYREGPYSEVVEANLVQMVKDGLVSKTSKWETYRLAPERTLQPVVGGGEMDDVEREIDLVASENTNVNDAVKNTYRMAPFKWYTTYNLEFKPKFERHFGDVLAGRESMYGARDILELLDDAVLDYPTVPEFMEHRMSFMDFAKIVNAFLRQDSYHTNEDMAKALRRLCDFIWETFAYGVRIHQHDPQYDEDVERWKNMYGNALRKLERRTLKHMNEFGDVGVDEPGLKPEIEDMVLHPERHVFTPLSLEDVVRDR